MSWLVEAQKLAEGGRDKAEGGGGGGGGGVVGGSGGGSNKRGGGGTGKAKAKAARRKPKRRALSKAQQREADNLAEAYKIAHGDMNATWALIGRLAAALKERTGITKPIA